MPGDDFFASRGDQWYNKADEYWKSVPATVNGMLGGFESLSAPDVRESRVFLRRLIENHSLDTEIALDCGAGIGRVTKNTLLPIFAKADLVELNPAFVAEARTLLPADRVENFFCSDLQDFTPQAGRYSVIWIQWVIGHLTDEDFVAFLDRCKTGLRPGGMVCIKDNVLKHGYAVDEDDSSITRSDGMIKALFAKSTLTLVDEALQAKFPASMMPVMMYALR